MKERLDKLETRVECLEDYYHELNEKFVKSTTQIGVSLQNLEKTIDKEIKPSLTYLVEANGRNCKNGNGSSGKVVAIQTELIKELIRALLTVVTVITGIKIASGI